MICNHITQILLLLGDQGVLQLEFPFLSFRFLPSTVKTRARKKTTNESKKQLFCMLKKFVSLTELKFYCACRQLCFLFNFFCVKFCVPLYSFLYSGKCSFYNQTSFTNNSYIPSYRKFFHEKPSERYHQARVFMLRQTGTNELQIRR